MIQPPAAADGSTPQQDFLLGQLAGQGSSKLPPSTRCSQSKLSTGKTARCPCWPLNITCQNECVCGVPKKPNNTDNLSQCAGLILLQAKTGREAAPLHQVRPVQAQR